MTFPHFNFQFIGEACKLMEECWKPNPSARLPAKRLQKNLEALAASCGLRTKPGPLEAPMYPSRAIKVSIPMINSGGMST